MSNGWGNEPYGNFAYGGSTDTTPPVVVVTGTTRTKISDETGFDSSTVSWFSNESGEYQVEIGGTGKGFGYFIESGSVTSGVAMETIITDNELENADPVLSDGIYRINIYVTDASNNTTPYES